MEYDQKNKVFFAEVRGKCPTAERVLTHQCNTFQKPGPRGTKRGKTKLGLEKGRRDKRVQVSFQEFYSCLVLLIFV